MLTIVLHNIQCTAFHGVYVEEQKIGNRFSINMEVDINDKNSIQHIQQTVNYEVLYEIILEYMKKSKQLLETIVQDLAHHILNHFTQAQTVRIELTKLSPPIANFNGTVGIRYQANK